MDLRKSHAAPTNLPMRPKNMPYYRGPRVQPVTKTGKSADALHIQSLITEIVMSTRNGNIALYNIPIHFGHVTPHCSSTAPPHALLNSEFASYAFYVMYFCWAAYSFSNGHFFSTIQSPSLPFHISMVCDPSDAGAPFLQNSHQTREFSVVAMTSFIILGHRVRLLSFTATLSILIAFSPARSHLPFGNCNWLSLCSCTSSGCFRLLLPSSSQITTSGE
jgi:hypothetical protein